MNIEELKKMVREIIKQELEETSTTGGVPGYLSAKAFSKDPKSTSNAGTEESERLGFTKAKETHNVIKKMYEVYYNKEWKLTNILKWINDNAAKRGASVKILSKEARPKPYGGKATNYDIRVGNLKIVVSDDKVPGAPRLNDVYVMIGKEIPDKKWAVKGVQLTSSDGDQSSFDREFEKQWKELKNPSAKLNEVSYNEYKKYPGMTSKQKLNMAIKECNRALWEVEKYLKQNKKLKEEESLGLDEYWKSTGRTLVKMNERLRRIQKEIKKFGVKEVAALLEAESQQMVDNVKSAFQDMTNTKVMAVEFGTYQGAKTFHVKFGKKMNIKPTELMNMYDDYYEGAEYGEPDKVKVPQIMGAPVKLSDDTYVFTIK